MIVEEVMLLKLGGGSSGTSSFWKCGGAYRYGGVHPERRLSVLIFAWAWHHERGEKFSLNSPRFQPFPCGKAL
jgi:hypothetical protein